MNELQYNTQKANITMREYGRYIQTLIQSLKTEKDSEKLKKHAEAIVKIMITLTPKTKSIDDYKQKIWSHLMYIANYELNIDVPYEIKEITIFKNNEMPFPYPKGVAYFKNYGKNVEQFIEFILKDSNVEHREILAYLVANYMKLVAKNWNNQSVTDEVVKKDLSRMSHNALVLADDINLNKIPENIGNNNNAKKKNNIKKNNNKRRFRSN